MHNGAELGRLLGSDRWRQFQAGTAVGLDLHVTLVGPDGSLTATSRTCPDCGTPFAPVNVADVTVGQAPGSHTAQPLAVSGRPGAVAGLGNGWIVVGQECSCSMSPARAPVDERLNVVRNLLHSFLQALQEGVAGGRRAVELSALRQMNRITLSLFRREGDAAERALNLVLSAMVIMLEAPASWLEYRSHGQARVLYRGDEQEARRARESRAGALVAEESRGEIWCCLGVVSPADREWAAALLPLLTQESVIVLEIDRLVRLLQDQLHLVLGAAGSPVLLVDQVSRITYANSAAADLIGRPTVQLIGLPAADLPAPWTPTLLDRLPEPARGRTDPLGPEHRRRWVDWEVSPLRDRGSIVGWLVMVHDRTDRHRWQQASRQAERMATTATLFNSLAHELRNPLAAARGLVELIGRQKDPDKVASFINVTLRELDRINSLLNDFMLLGRPARMVPEPLDLVTFLGGLLPVMAGEVAGAQVEIRTHFEPVPPVYGDPGQLAQVVMNLVRNGAEAAGRRGWVALELRGGAGGTVLTVADSGPGLAPGAAAKLFEPFFTTKKGGVGLGLSVCQAIVLNHGGRITAANAAGAGAAFSVWLPARPDNHPVLSSLDVLVVMGNSITRVACSQALQVSGMSVAAAGSLPEALHETERSRPGVLILDATVLQKEEIARLQKAVPGAPILVAGEPPAWQGPAGVIFLAQPLDYAAVIEQVEALLQPALPPRWTTDDPGTG